MALVIGGLVAIQRESDATVIGIADNGALGVLCSGDKSAGRIVISYLL